MTAACKAHPNAARPWTCGPGALVMDLSLLIQLQHGHEGLGGQLHGTQRTHLFLACPTKSLDFAGSPLGFDLLGRSESALRQALPAANPLYGADAPPLLCGAPEGKNKMLRASLVQLQHGHEGLGGQLHGSQRPHLFLALFLLFQELLLFRLMSPP